MTSKEKRQLRNKISARNFRVRRKEYISTLEGDIAERDRLLDAIRTELGSSKSENLALRQEIATLKRTLLDGRGVGQDIDIAGLHLPPPAPLPEFSAAEVLAAAASSSSTYSSSSTALVTPNTQKDLPSSSASRPGFWGGFGGGGVTPVHTTLLPDMNVHAAGKMQENMNPAMNAREGVTPLSSANINKALGGFDGFADLNPFTMKTLDAYRMHLWGKMAAQHHQHQQQQQKQQQPTLPLTGLASNLRPHFFNSSSSSSKPNLPATYNGYGSTLSALLSGKQASSSYPTPPSSPPSSSSGYPTPPSPLLLGGKDVHTQTQSQKQQQQQQEREVQHAVLAAMASQTIFRKMGSAFWDAFSGSSSSSSSSPSSSMGQGASSSRSWDADKVRRVLEGKAVVRVVDVDQVTPPASPKVRAATPSVRASTPVVQKVPVSQGVPVSPKLRATTPTTRQGRCQMTLEEKKKRCADTMCDILEESMRSLTLSKKM